MPSATIEQGIGTEVPPTRVATTPAAVGAASAAMLVVAGKNARLEVLLSFPRC